MSRNRIEQHPDEYRDDLNPNYTAGENYGQPTYDTLPASENKEIVEALSFLRVDQLRQIPIIQSGGRLEQGAVYFDLRHPERGELKALGCMEAGRDNWYVPKSETDYELWNLLIGVDNWDRLGRLVPEAENEEETAPAGMGPGGGR
ncbi:MAG: hypothetical protein ACK47B_16460 [Armatimonadota bacterium]